jgi:chromosomal replication initiation ATPase DnaA
MTELSSAAAALFEVAPHALVNGCRERHINQARQALMWAIRECYPAISFETIGDLLGHRHHTTVMHGVTAAAQRAIADADYALKLAALRQ